MRQARFKGNRGVYKCQTLGTLHNLTPLEDDLFALPPYHAIILVNNARAKDPEFIAALSPLTDAIDDDAMRAMNIQFDVDKRDPQDIARDYLREAHFAKA